MENNTRNTIHCNFSNKCLILNLWISQALRVGLRVAQSQDYACLVSHHEINTETRNTVLTKHSDTQDTSEFILKI